MSRTSALIIVDLQNDFMPWGALPVKNGNDVIEVANSLLRHFDIVVASMDWHPSNHGSFASQYRGKNPGELVILEGIQQVLWPEHCIQDSHGAQFAASLKSSEIHKIIYKGTDPKIDSYSVFFDNAHSKQTGLHHFLQENKVSDVYILGVATDYCVKFSVLDAINLGYRAFVVVDGCRGVNLEAADSQRALDEMKDAGAILVESADVPAELS